MMFSHIPDFHGATDIADFYSATADLHSGILFRDTWFDIADFYSATFVFCRQSDILVAVVIVVVARLVRTERKSR